MDDSREERRNRVMVGNLPADFLRLGLGENRSGPGNFDQNGPLMANPVARPEDDFCPELRLASRSLNNSPRSRRPDHRNSPRLRRPLPYAYMVGVLNITIVEAELVKNYGLTKMDPYARLRVGHHLSSTTSDIRGGKHPSWNRTFNVDLPEGIRTIFFDIYDERALVADERIAWGHLSLPENLFEGEYLNLWIDLSGKQGQDKEGKLHIMCLFTPADLQPAHIAYPTAPAMVATTSFFTGMPFYSTRAPHALVCYANQPPLQPHPDQPYANTPQPCMADVQELREMFPAFDREIILSVLQNCSQKKTEAISMLNSMCN